MSKETNIRIESPGVNVAVVKKDDDGWKFLVLKRAESVSYPGCWGFMTGGKRGDESVAQVVARELKEETGLVASAIWATEYLVQFYEPECDSIWILPLIVAVVPPEVGVKLSPENTEYRWLARTKAKHLVSWKNLVEAIEHVSEELEIYPARNWVLIKA